MRKMEGDVVLRGSISYAPQNPWHAHSNQQLLASQPTDIFAGYYLRQFETTFYSRMNTTKHFIPWSLMVCLPYLLR